MKVVTPEMIDEALLDRICAEVPVVRGGFRGLSRSVLVWLANNPIEPTEEQWSEVYRTDTSRSFREDASTAATDFQRIAYLKKEEPLPKELKDMLCDEYLSDTYAVRRDTYNREIIAAYKLGKESK